MDREMKEYKAKVELELMDNHKRIMAMTIEEIQAEYEAKKEVEKYDN